MLFNKKKCFLKYFKNIKSDTSIKRSSGIHYLIYHTLVQNLNQNTKL